MSAPGLPAELQLLRIFKDEALERMGDNDRVIEVQRERIAELEFHLGKCRDSAYEMCYATVGVLPIDFVPDAKRKAVKRKTAEVAQ